ncbi:S41 family peptidase [Bacteroidota bacterium]
MLRQIEITLNVACLLLSVIFLTLIIIRIRNIYFKKKARVSIWNKKVSIINKVSKLFMAISLILLVSGIIYFILFVSTHTMFIRVYAKTLFCIIFIIWALLEAFLCLSISEKLLNNSIFRRIVFFCTVIICIIGAAYLFPPILSSLLHPVESYNNEQQVMLPDTPCGRCASDYYKAFNSGNNDQMQAFIQKYRSESYIERRTMKKLIESYKFMHTISGLLTPVRLIQVSEHEIIIFARTTSRQINLVKTRFKVDISEPHYLLMFTITPTTPEEALQLTTINPNIIDSTIDSLAAILRKSYVDPEKGEIMADTLIYYISTGRYSQITDGSVLSLRLTEDLWPLCHDKHLDITFGKIPEEDTLSIPEPDKTDNYGFCKIDVLENNIGYIRFDEFHHSVEAKNVAAQAMDKVANCDALIFDLRYNGGGSPDFVIFMSSYLFDKPTLIGSRYSRIHKNTKEYWTFTDIPGKSFGTNKPIYVLTSSNTYSAAEAFAYFLKDLKRASIVGETTRGGAHPIMHISINDYFGVRIPFARIMSPVSKTDWEGIGVIPNIKVSMDKALDAACKDAVKKLKN